MTVLAPIKRFGSSQLIIGKHISANVETKGTKMDSLSFLFTLISLPPLLAAALVATGSIPPWVRLLLLVVGFMFFIPSLFLQAKFADWNWMNTPMSPLSAVTFSGASIAVVLAVVMWGWRRATRAP